LTTEKAYLLDAGLTGYAQILEEKNDTGGLIKSYTLGDDIISQTANHNSSFITHHFLYDGHGSTRLLIGSSTGNPYVAAQYNYDAYGKNLFDTSNTATNMLYSGEQFDPNLQMQYLRARYYDQNNGTFNRLDPFAGNNSDPQSLHKYAYTHCDPVNGIDPSGFRTLSELLSVFKINFSLGTFVFKGITNAVTNGLVDLIFAVFTGDISKDGYWTNFGIDFATNFAIGGIIGGGVSSNISQLKIVKKIFNYKLAKLFIKFLRIPAIIKSVIGTVINYYKERAKGNKWSSERLRDEILFNIAFSLIFDSLNAGFKKVRLDNTKNMSQHYKTTYKNAKKRILQLRRGRTGKYVKNAEKNWDTAVKFAIQMNTTENMLKILTDSTLGELIFGITKNVFKKVSPIQPVTQ
jgi:RHS repeat-associated protein